MSDPERFETEKRARIAAMAADAGFRRLSREWFDASCRHRYSYHFTWLGLPVIQYPQDIVALQEIIWRTRPELVVETGIARGGSLVLHASMLELLGGRGRVVGVDIDIRPHNRAALESHPLARRIVLIEGSSVDPDVAQQVHRLARGLHSVLVVLDSNHTHVHVARELELYSPLVRPGGPWGPGNNPRTAVHAFLAANDRFVVDSEMEAKLALTVAPGGYLRCVKDPGSPEP